MRRHMKRTYTAKDIAKLGIKRERMKNWLERGFVRPSIKTANGAGTRNIFSRCDLYAIMLFRSLVCHGFSRENSALKIRAMMKFGDLAGLDLFQDALFVILSQIQES